MKAMIIRLLRSLSEIADGSQVRWFVREQMMAATVDDLLEIR
jgi:hypothetical protein